MNYIQNLVNIYNNFLTIHTCGEDSFIYTSCMKELRAIIEQMAQKQKENENKEV